MGQTEIIIIGGGAIGLATGWRLAQQGKEVVVLERGRAGRGTSWLAAGMLAPAAEIQFEELELYRLNRESWHRWPAFVDELEEVSGVSVDFRTEGTLVVADDRDRAEALQRLFEFQEEHNVPVEWLTVDQALEREPFLSPQIAAAVYAPEDYQVDNRLLVNALAIAFQEAGGTLQEETAVTGVEPDEECPRVTTAAGERLDAETVVVATGVWTNRIDGLEKDVFPAIRPVKGQMIQLQMERPFDLQHVVRGRDAYLAPKSNGRLLVGATSEEKGFDTDVTGGGLYRLLEGGWEVVPGIEELPITDTWAGLRPASRDYAPVIGWSNLPGVFCATGHFRHGILLTPVTADEAARFIMTGEASDWIESFTPNRLNSPSPSGSK